MNKRQPPFLFSVIIAFFFCFQISFAAPPAPSGSDSSTNVSQSAKPPAWTIPENEAAYPALLMPQDHQGLNMVGYLKQSEDQALARFAAQGYVKAPPEQAAKLERALLTNIALRLDVAGKTITAKEKTAVHGARYVVVEKRKPATVSPQSTSAPPVKTASVANDAVPKPGGQ